MTDELLESSQKKYDPVNDLNDDGWHSLRLDTKYYNTELHKACFALPNYVIDLLNSAK